MSSALAALVENRRVTFVPAVPATTIENDRLSHSGDSSSTRSNSARNASSGTVQSTSISTTPVILSPQRVQLVNGMVTK